MKNRVRLIVKISGIRCAGCLNSIDRALSTLEVEKFDYDFYTSMGSFWYQGYLDDDSVYLNAILQAGYGVMKIACYYEKAEDVS